MKHILYIHQSPELYGSDKVLLNIVTNINREQFEPIVVVPEDGDLLYRLQDYGIETFIAPVLKIERSIATSIRATGLLPEACKAIRALDCINRKFNISLVHSNTLAVLGGAIWARLRDIPHVWHVHEIIQAPIVAKFGYPKLLRALSDMVLCNSKATYDWIISKAPGLEDRTEVIWNGIKPVDSIRLLDKKSVRRLLNIDEDVLTIALVGRINRLKGHQLLLEAARILNQRGYKQLIYIFVGDTYKSRTHYMNEIVEKIVKLKLQDQIVITGYVKDIYSLWNAIDIAIVPSTEPESFGLVALEAMAMAKPVIASRHGGIVEIVVDGETGIFFTPNCAKNLADAVETLIKEPVIRRKMGEAGRLRLQCFFTVENQVKKLEKIYSDLLTI